MQQLLKSGTKSNISDKKDISEKKPDISVQNKTVSGDFPKLTSLSFSPRLSAERHVMYTIVDRYDIERETWSKSTLIKAQVYDNIF